jgi:mannose-6-phosphate isomerase-like protein (cupin superfamily)
MRAPTKLFVSGLFIGLAAFASLPRVVAAQTVSGKLEWTLILNETRGPLRSADVSTPLGKTAVSEILGGPTSGSANGYIIYTRMPSGSHGPALFTLPVEDDYVVLTGKMSVQIGTDKFVAGPQTAVIIPANIPHKVWNAEADAEANFEVIASGNPNKDLSRDLKSMLRPVQPTKVENAAQYIREIKAPAASDLKPGLNRQVVANMIEGSPITVLFDSTLPGSGGPPTHVHTFEQVYFTVEGETTIPYGVDILKAKKNDIVIIPPGVVHTNMNKSNSVERHITLLLPEPTVPPFDTEFRMIGPLGSPNPDFKGGPPHQ